jgi:hypothetical protein
VWRRNRIEQCARDILLADRKSLIYKGESLVPEKGVEPSRPCGQRILSPPRLPFRHSGVPPILHDPRGAPKPTIHASRPVKLVTTTYARRDPPPESPPCAQANGKTGPSQTLRTRERQEEERHYALLIITSVALMSAATVSPTFRCISRTASAVITDVMCCPPIEILTCAIKPLVLISTIRPTS